MSPLLQIRGGRRLDPATGLNSVGDLWIQDGRIVPAPTHPPGNVRIFDAAGQWVAPSLTDLHVHLREPGNDAAETVESGTRAAAAGGFGTVVSMPNTRPPTDSPELVRETIEKARRAGFAHVRPSACLTRNRAGEETADLEALAEAGAAVFTDDGSTVLSDAVMREAMIRAARLNRAVMDHAQDPAAERRGVLHEGEAARRLGLPGIPSSAEARIIRRDFALALETGCAIHIQHLTSLEGVALLRDAKRQGVRASAEVTPHHLAFCDEDIPGNDANWKMNPPLRGPADRESLIEAVCDGTIACFATDHAPHTAESKAGGFATAPFGVIGLETALGVTYTALVKNRRMDVMTWLRLWTTGPAGLLGFPLPTLAPGAPADLVVMDLESEWTVKRFVSRSVNSPFIGRRLTGCATATFLGGRDVYRRNVS
ncbi:MAG: dihydroorotase [Kiritimatiellia bacterium]|nr:dihydroorotase [Kiritimatiellia bacterium]